MNPPASSSLSSTRTISLISRRLEVGPVGTHGTSTQVRLRCNDLSSDMKSHTAKTWCSMKVTMASCESRRAYISWVVTVERVLATAALSRLIPAWSWFHSYRDMCLPPPYAMRTARASDVDICFG